MRRLSVLAAAAMLAAGCGGDDEEDTPEQQPVAPAPAAPQTDEAEPTQTEEQPPETESEPSSPEDEPGGAGDEEPIRSEAVFTGRNGEIKPARIAVPAYIAVIVRLNKADDGDYTVTFEGKTIAPGEELPFDGLRPNERVVGRGSDGSRLVISATAEPGP